MSDESSFHPPDDELLQRAEQFATDARRLLEDTKGVQAGVTHDALASLHYFLQSQACYAELNRRQAVRRADSERKHNEKIEKRDFWMEVGVMVLIGFEIILSVIGLWMGHQQGKVLDKQTTALTHMDTSTAATATLLDNLARDQAASRKILEKQEADRLAQQNKKPLLALLVNGFPLAKAHAPIKPINEQGGSATYHLELWNKGDADANLLTFRVLLPKDIFLNANQPGFFPEPHQPDTSTQSFVYSAQLSIQPARYAAWDIYVAVPKGHSAFQLTFQVLLEDGTPLPLGALSVTPLTPTK